MSKIDLDRLKSVKTIYSHSFCPDGLSAAMICRAAYASIGLSPEIVFINYDTLEHENMEPGPNQLFIDITPPIKRWEEWIPFSPIVLDHHDTVKHVSEALGVYGDTNDSGASLAFKYVMKPLFPLDKHKNDVKLADWARFAWLNMIRDTWKDKHEDWRDACSIAQALGFYSSNSLLISASELELNITEMLRFGGVLLKKSDGKARRVAENALNITQHGLKVSYFNLTEKLMSEVGHELLQKGNDISIGFFHLVEAADVVTAFSLRSHKDGFPVNKLAEKFGGGGHHSAAGFSLRGTYDLSIHDFINKIGNEIKLLVSFSVEND